MTTTTTAAATPTTGLQSMQFVRGLLNQLLETIPENKLTHQPFPGGNHPLWIMGHMAYTDDYFMTKLTGAKSALPAGWDKTFGHGSEPTSDASAYPSQADVKRHFEEQHQRILGWAEALDESTANAAVPKGWERMGATNAFLPGFFAAHEAMHVGQVTAVRKSLGMKPINA